ncbi:MAG: LytTR family transcriptional regulator [Sphingopyxis sp.]|nr:LytTR family transcriptional regulator [Sphingopyxis sp.]
MQGNFLAAYRGAPQPWWPTLGYTAAIYSIWAMLSWPIIGAVIAIERGIRRVWARIAAYLLLWPIVIGAHVALFALIYWPVYRSAGVATRWDMTSIMFVRNLDTNSLLYLALVALTIAWLRWPRRQAERAKATPPADDNALIIRNRGTVHRLPFATIDWIGAAGDYAEIHSTGRAYLIEESLTSLAQRLPAGQFARIHRGALIRIDRVHEIEPIGRGDAHVRLVTGAELRLSRRYRANLTALLSPRSAPAKPAQ